MTEIVQGSDAWKALRLGKATASRIADIVAKTKSGYAASRANYLAELLIERTTGVPTEGFVSAEMRWGTEKEADAVAAYEFHRNVETTKVCFVGHPRITMAGASPDRLVGDDGMIEVKCPNSATHLETLLSQTVPSRYLTQIQWQMSCTGRAWTDYVSFDPRFAEPMQLFVKRVERDAARIVELEREVSAFLAELDSKMDEIAKRFPAVMPLAAAAE